jgi:hypothetical protein
VKIAEAHHRRCPTRDLQLPQTSTDPPTFVMTMVQHLLPTQGLLLLRQPIVPIVMRIFLETNVALHHR